MKYRISSVVFFIGVIFALGGCQTAAPQKVASAAPVKCAPIHNLSQAKRKACTAQTVIHTATLDD